MEKSESIVELAIALNKAQAQMGGAVKDASNPYFKSKYADLPSVIIACKEELSKNGLSISQLVTSDEAGNSYVETVLMHLSGQWISSKMRLYLSKTDMQGLGSAISYARRYSLQAILNIPAVDDDAESAVDRSTTGHPSAKLSHSDAHPDLPELMELGKKAFNGSKSNFLAWIEMNFKVSDPMALKSPQIEKAKSLLLDVIAQKESK
jgi:hypothetical protein